MSKVNHQQTPAQRRKKRIFAKVRGTADRPRLSVFRSNKNIYLQVIDDSQGKTLVSGDDKKFTGTKKETATLAAVDLAEKLKKAKITALRFDRGSYKYHGRLTAVAQALRQAKIKV